MIRSIFSINPTLNRSFALTQGAANAWILGGPTKLVRSPETRIGLAEPVVVGYESTIFTRPVGPNRVLEFTGTNTANRINLGSIPTDHELQGGPTFSVYARVYRTAPTGSFLRIIDKSDSISSSNGWSLIWREPNDAYEFAIASGGGPRSGTGTPVGVWMNVLVWRTNGVCNFAINGEMSGTEDQTLTTSFPSVATNAAIGNWNHNTSRDWSGFIDFVFVSLSAPTKNEAKFLTLPGNEYLIFQPEVDYPYGAFVQAATPTNDYTRMFLAA